MSDLKLVGKCPTCDRPVRLPFFTVATIVVRRRCACGTRWSVKVVPVPTRRTGVYVHSLTYVELSR